mmetsp:Transcript_88323/g.175587  ORF Transcript_88323/g.175587 Transcript_88323/m.175587 type:complete len:286 (-) Transcript_88323:890-1747(-)
MIRCNDCVVDTLCVSLHLLPQLDHPGLNSFVQCEDCDHGAKIVKSHQATQGTLTRPNFDNSLQAQCDDVVSTHIHTSKLAVQLLQGLYTQIDGVNGKHVYPRIESAIIERKVCMEENREKAISHNKIFNVNVQLEELKPLTAQQDPCNDRSITRYLVHCDFVIISSEEQIASRNQTKNLPVVKVCSCCMLLQHAAFQRNQVTNNEHIYPRLSPTSKPTVLFGNGDDTCLEIKVLRGAILDENLACWSCQRSAIWLHRMARPTPEEFQRAERSKAYDQIIRFNRAV